MTPRLLSVPTGESAVVINREGFPLGSAHDYLSEPMADALSDGAVQTRVNNDATAITSKIGAGRMDLLDITIRLGIVDCEENGFVEFGRDENSIVLIPGLSGIESYDVYGGDLLSDVTNDEEARAVLGVRLYCGLTLAHLALNKRMNIDNFFKVKFRKVFGVKDQGISDKIDTFNDSGRKKLATRQRLHMRYSMARLAAGVVLHTFTHDDDTAMARDLLAVRYEEELAQSEMCIDKVIELLKYNEQRLPLDIIPTTARGYVNPLDEQSVERLLYGSLKSV